MHSVIDRAFAKINKRALENNYNLIKEKIRSKKKGVIAVVKANAYGHGYNLVCPILQEMGVLFFAVATVEEGISIRKQNIKGKILVLGYSSILDIERALFYDLTLTIYSVEYLKAVLNVKPKVKYHILVDSGMNRLGLTLKDIEKHQKEIKKLYSLGLIDGIFTHFATGFGESFLKQVEIFNNAKLFLGLDFEFCHAENTLATLYGNNLLGVNFVRVGLALYGLTENSSFINENKSGMNAEFLNEKNFMPVLSLKAKVAKIFEIKKGEGVSYDRTFIANENKKIATVCFGYADGLSRALGNNGHMLISGNKAKIVGRVCMDYCMLDVSPFNLPHKTDIFATIIGKDGENQITANQIAENLNTISYEIVTNISSRVKRILA